MAPDLWKLFELMLRSRLFEEAITQLWHEGLISGEMHLGTGEEAIVTCVVSHLIKGDSMALDHRGTSALLLRGIDPVSIIRELLGRADGLCGGMGGHMHLFSKDDLIASSGIVGAAGPTAAGFALSARYLRPGTISVAFFGDGSMNQGMLLESMNLASVWKLPVLFVCKDDGWAITTKSEELTGGILSDRAKGLGIPYTEADGKDVKNVWEEAGKAIKSIREGGGPIFLHSRCVHLEGHFLGLQLLRVIRNPLKEIPKIAGPLTRSFFRISTASIGERVSGLSVLTSAILRTIRDPRKDSENDPVVFTRKMLEFDRRRLGELENSIAKEISGIVQSAIGDTL
jgi:pyruvate dehydrogenase E1 component alpha subunit